MQGEECLLWFALAGDESECPIGNFLLAGEPFVGPREEDGSCKAAPHYAFGMPAEHLRLFVFTVADRIHSELAQYQRLVFR